MGVVELVAPGQDHGARLGLGGEVVPGQNFVFEGGEKRFGSGDIDPHDGVLTVRLDPLPTRRATTAIAELCEHLTATHSRYPGTNLTLRYEIKTQP